MDKVVKGLLETTSSNPDVVRGALWRMPQSTFSATVEKLDKLRTWPVRVPFPTEATSEAGFIAACVKRDMLDARWYWDVLIRQGVEGFVNMLQVEPPMSFLYLRCKLTRQHVAAQSVARTPEERFCVNCYKPMPNAPLGFWDPVTRVFRY